MLRFPLMFFGKLAVGHSSTIMMSMLQLKRPAENQRWANHMLIDQVEAQDSHVLW